MTYQAHPNHLIHLTHCFKDPTSNDRHIPSAGVRTSIYRSWGAQFSLQQLLVVICEVNE